MQFAVINFMPILLKVFHIIISELVHLSFDLCDKSYMISFNSPIYNMYN